MKVSKLVFILTLIIVLAGVSAYAQNCNVKFEDVVKKQIGGYCTANDWVIDNQTDLLGFWKQVYATMIPQPECPTVDFDNYVVIVTAMGQENNSCYNTEIICIEDDGNGNYTVYVDDTYPQPGDQCQQVMVCPVHAVIAAAPSGTVTFQH